MANHTNMVELVYFRKRNLIWRYIMESIFLSCMINEAFGCFTAESAHVYYYYMFIIGPKRI